MSQEWAGAGEWLSSGQELHHPDRALLRDIERGADGSIFDAFAEVAARHAAREAIVTPERRLTYAELLALAEQDHARLAAAGVGRGTGIGIMSADPVGQIAGILGTLRAGCHYVVLDLDGPRERLAAIVRDGSVSAVLADRASVPAAHAIAPAATRLIVGDDAPVHDVPPAAQARADDLAYVAYTSGSTGAPKGVMHPHANVLHEAAVHRATLGLGPDDRSTLLYSPAVTGSVRDIFGTLLSGACLCPFPFRRHGLRALAAWISEQRITQLHAVPTILRELLAALAPDERLEALRVTFVAGDAVTPADVRAFRRHAPPTARFYTGIGATETSSIYTHWFVTGEEWPDGRLPSGWSIPHKDVLLVGDDRVPLDPKDRREGEIAVRSRYLATGYWNAPSLTMAAFDQTPDASGRRTYFTGDRGYFDGAGRLVHLGRADRQLKINGERIELGEIEHALRAQRGVVAAAARAITIGVGRPRIVAYVVAAASGFDETAIAESLSRRLSAAAMPAAIVRMNEMPRTSTQKIDYPSLPVPEVLTAPAATTDWTADERRVLQVWREVFPGRDSFGRDETFERLGGDSLTALRLSALLRARLQMEWPPLDPMRTESIASMAARLGPPPAVGPTSPWLRHLAHLASSWRLADEGAPVGNGPVHLLGGDAPGVPMVWFAQPDNGLRIARAVARSRPVYVIPSSAPPDASSMDRAVREVAAHLAPHLPMGVMCGGTCYSGLEAMLLGRALQERGYDVGSLVLVDALGSRRARWVQYQLFRLQSRWPQLRAPLAMLRADWGRLMERRRAAADPTGMPPGHPQPYLIDFEPFGYAGSTVQVLSGNAAWLRAVIPDLGWTAAERQRTRLHVVPGNHTDMWGDAGVEAIAGIVEEVAKPLDAAAAEAASPLSNIADTARWVAVYRARESRHPQAAFQDPLAGRLAGARGEAIVRALRADDLAASIVARTAAIDDFVRHAVANGVDTVVNLAAGLDTRPYRLDLPSGLHWVEADLDEIVSYKTGRLADERPRCRLSRVSIDLSDDGARSELLARVSRDARRMLVITEGLLVYWPQASVEKLARELASLPSVAFWAQDFVAPDTIVALNHRWGGVLRHAAATMVFAPSDGPAFFAPFGWRVNQVRTFAEEATRLALASRYPDAERIRGAQSPTTSSMGFVLLERGV